MNPAANGFWVAANVQLASEQHWITSNGTLDYQLHITSNGMLGLWARTVPTNSQTISLSLDGVTLASKPEGAFPAVCRHSENTLEQLTFVLAYGACKIQTGTAGWLDTTSIEGTPANAVLTVLPRMIC